MRLASAFQDINAAQFMQRKAGLWIPRRRDIVMQAERALKALFCTPTYKEHIREIQEPIVREDGVATLCTVVEQLLCDFYGSPND